MPFFYSKSKDFLLYTNFKVMYSTLRKQDSLKRLKGILLWMYRGKKTYVLGRDPYSRLESFYRDKLNKDLGIDKKLVRSQKIFLPHVGLNRWSKKKDVVEKLGAIDFPDFIELLPKVYMKNRHLHPQVKIFQGIESPVKLRIEDKESMETLQSTFGIDTTLRVNKTNREQFILEWTPEMYRIVNDLYKDDFEFFGYGMKN